MIDTEKKSLFPLDETENLWNLLAHADRPLVLYGMGNGAEKLLLKAKEYGIPVADIFASDEFVRGQIFAGYKVKKFQEITEAYEDPIIMLAFGTEDPEVLKRIYQMADRYEVLAPDVPLFGKDTFNEKELEERKDRLLALYEKLADEKSHEVFRDLLNYRVSGKISYLKKMETERRDIFDDIFAFSAGESYVDLGAYDGDTIAEFLGVTGGQYTEIIALEPDKKNFVKLEKRMETLGISAELHQAASWNEDTELIFAGKAGRNSALGEKGYTVKAVAVDHILNGRRAGYIKMDVEGAEKETLLGLQETLKAFAPALAVSAYHRSWDFLELAECIWELQPDYEIYLRHHPYIPAWETNIYAVRKKAEQH